MNSVWKESRQAGGKLLLLLAIADFANDAGMAYPGIATLAEKTRQHRRTVQRQLSDLEEEGEIAIEPGTGRANTNTYWVLAGMDHHTRAKIIHDCKKLKGGNLPPIPEDKKGGVPCLKGGVPSTKRVASDPPEDLKGGVPCLKGGTAVPPEPSLTVIKDINRQDINRYQPRTLLTKIIETFQMDPLGTNTNKIVALLHKCRPRENGPGSLILQVADPAERAWCESRLTAPIERMLPGIAGRQMVVEFVSEKEL
jgi:hypothetical protein